MLIQSDLDLRHLLERNHMSMASGSGSVFRKAAGRRTNAKAFVVAQGKHMACESAQSDSQPWQYNIAVMRAHIRRCRLRSRCIA